MLPQVALIDPALTLDLPRELTATTGMDALTQLIEAFVSNRANPMTDTLCQAGIIRAARSIRSAFHEGSNLNARIEMSLAALYSGMALANARLGAVHGIAGPLGGMIAAPHGGICARLLPIVMAANLKAIQDRDPETPALDRFKLVAQLLTGSQSASAEDSVAFLKDLCSDLCIPPLGGYGLAESDLPQLIANALKSSSMQGNPVTLTPAEVEAIVRSAM
jgi:alcohol dehydrogenase class IV